MSDLLFVVDLQTLHSWSSLLLVSRGYGWVRLRLSSLGGQNVKLLGTKIELGRVGALKQNRGHLVRRSCSTVTQPAVTATSQPSRQVKPTSLSQRLNVLAANTLPQPQRIKAREPMAWSDAYWLRLPGDNLITWVLQGKGSLSQLELQTFVQHRLLTLPRFTQRPVLRCPGQWEWHAVESVDLQHHVQAMQLGVGNKARQRSAIWTSWAERPMSRERPLWDMLLVQERERFAIVFRVHHALCDGKGMMETLLQLQPNRVAAANMWSLVHATKQHANVGRQAWYHAVLWWNDVIFSPVPRLLHVDSPMERRKFAYLARPWPLSQLKAIAQANGGGTVNDVALTLLAGALTKALAAQGELVHQQVQVLLPLLRPEASQRYWWPHNSVTSGVCQIPLGDMAFQERLAKIRIATSGLKSDIIPALMEHTAKLIVSLPLPWINVMVQQLTNQLASIVSNVRGLPEPITFAERTIDRIVWFGPRFGTVGLHVPMVSYKGSLELGIVLDKRLQLEPEQICAYLRQEYRKACLASFSRSAIAESMGPMRQVKISRIPSCNGYRSPVDEPSK